jgi:hypothetical protein
MTRSTFKTSVSHGFACTSNQAMSRVTKEHLAWRDLRVNPSIRRDSVPMQLRWIKIFECLVRRAKGLCHVTMALRTNHTWEKSLVHQTEQGLDLDRRRLRMLYELST